jgi:hypothetical protein
MDSRRKLFVRAGKCYLRYNTSRLPFIGILASVKSRCGETRLKVIDGHVNVIDIGSLDHFCVLIGTNKDPAQKI